MTYFKEPDLLVLLQASQNGYLPVDGESCHEFEPWYSHM